MCSDLSSYSDTPSDIPSLFWQLKLDFFSSFVSGSSTSQHLSSISSKLSNPIFLSNLALRLFHPESTSQRGKREEGENGNNVSLRDFEILQNLSLTLQRKPQGVGIGVGDDDGYGTLLMSSAKTEAPAHLPHADCPELPELDLGLDLTEFVLEEKEDGTCSGFSTTENCSAAVVGSCCCPGNVDARNDSESILERYCGTSEGTALIRSQLTRLGVSHELSERQIVESFVGTLCESFGGVLSNQGRSKDGLFRVVYPSKFPAACSTPHGCRRSSYFGEFTDGLRMGFGVYVYETKKQYRDVDVDTKTCDEMFIGQWQNDKRWGVGIFRHRTGAVLLARFRDTGFSVEEQQVTVWFPNGDIFRGSMNRFEMRRGMYFSLGSNATFIGEFGFRSCFGVVMEGNGIVMSRQRLVTESSSFRIAQTEVGGEICDELVFCKGRKLTLMSMRRWSLPKETLVQEFVQGVQLHHCTLNASLLLNLIEFGSLEDICHLLEVRRRFSLPFSVDMLTLGDAQWVSPLVFAVQVSRLDVFRFLLARPEISVDGTSGRRGTGFLFWTTPLAQAILCEDTDEYFDLLLLRQDIDLSLGQETTTWSLEDGEKCTNESSSANMCFTRRRMDWLARLYDLGVSLDTVADRDSEFVGQFSSSTKWDTAGIVARIHAVSAPWVPERHLLFPRCFRQHVWTLLLVSERVRHLPLEILREILSYVSKWHPSPQYVAGRHSIRGLVLTLFTVYFLVLCAMFFQTVRSGLQSLSLPPFDADGDEICEWDFVWERVLGEGSYGEVHLVTYLRDSQQYAIKKINKGVCCRAGMLKTLLVERQVLIALRDVDSVVRMYHSFEDDDHLFIVLEYVPGGTLADLIQRKGGTLPIELARHYAAEILLVIRHLKRKKIVHRDLKPENILLTEDGHIRLTDFGTAKMVGFRNRDGIAQLKSRTFAKNTFCGTALYLSPEILWDRPCSYLTDTWGFAVLLFFMLTGTFPFRAPFPLLLFNKIKHRQIEWPKGLDQVARHLLDRILQIRPKLRLGFGRNGFRLIMAHGFFDGIDFEAVLEVEPGSFGSYGASVLGSCLPDPGDDPVLAPGEEEQGLEPHESISQLFDQKTLLSTICVAESEDEEAVLSSLGTNRQVKVVQMSLKGSLLEIQVQSTERESLQECLERKIQAGDYRVLGVKDEDE